MTMTRRTAAGGLILATGLLGPFARAAEPSSDLIGTWSGRLNVGAVSLRLRLIVSDANTAKVISLDQGSAESPASKVELSATSIMLEFKAIGAKFEGKLKGRDTLEGVFTQGGAIPLILKRGEAIEDVPASEPLTQILLNDARSNARTPAMIAGWQKRDGARVVLCDGDRSAEANIPVTAEDQWHWGLITKSMTATVAARLVEAGKIKWTSTVGEVLGAKGKIRDEYKSVTLLHLLSHRAGLQPNLDIAAMLLYTRDPLADARAERLRYALAVLDQKPAAGLAEQMIYSNNGFVVAGAMLEAVTGTPWEALIKAELFGPMGLKSAGFGAPGTMGKVDQPLGHMVQGERRVPAKVGPGAINDNPTALGPAGRVHMSVGDMLTYLAAHRDQPESYLKSGSWAKLHTPPFGGDYALGWMVKGDGTLWHNGSNTLWYAEVLFNPKTGIVAAAAANDAALQTQMAVNKVIGEAVTAGLK
jgi:CubicO group peptidase (beta-lactamase class C family)